MYHQGNNTVEADNDSLGSIKTSITNIHQAHNANAVAMTNNIPAIPAESAQQKEKIAELQRQIALLTVASPSTPLPLTPALQQYGPVQPYYVQPLQPRTAYAVQPPPQSPVVPPYVPVNPPTYYVGHQYDHRGCGGHSRGQSKGRGGQGRDEYTPRTPQQLAPPVPTMQNAVPPPPGQQRPVYSNVTKHFNNWVEG